MKREEDWITTGFWDVLKTRLRKVMEWKYLSKGCVAEQKCATETNTLLFPVNPNSILPFIVTRHASGSLSLSDTEQLPRKRPATSKLHTLIVLNKYFGTFSLTLISVRKQAKKARAERNSHYPQLCKKNWKSYYKMEHQEKLKICVTTAFQSCASRMHDTIMRRLKGKCGGEHAQWIAIHMSSKAHSAGKSTPVPYLP